MFDKTATPRSIIYDIPQAACVAGMPEVVRHSRCWSPWHERRIQRAAEALWKLGIATKQHSEV